MALVVKTRNQTTLSQCNHYLSFDDFEVGKLTKEFVVRHNYLSLGKTLGDWNRSTETETKKIYGELIRVATDCLGQSPVFKPLTSRKVEILVGHICFYLALRMSRATMQIRLIPSGESLVSLLPPPPRRIELELPQTSEDSIRLLQTEEFESLIDYSMALQRFELKEQVLVKQEPRSENQSRQPFRFRDKAFLLVQKLAAPLARKNSYLISSTYLPRISEFFLSLILGQTPALTEIREGQNQQVSLSRSVEVGLGGDIQDVGLALLKILVPANLLECSLETKKRAFRIGMPSNPIVAFTANSFDTDDEFKATVAGATQIPRYVVAQHGVGYGVSHTRDICPEIRTSDWFITWGWSTHQGEALGIIKGVRRVPRRTKHKKVVLILRPDSFRFYQFADEAWINAEYVRLISALCTRLEEQQITTILRFHPSTSSQTKTKLISVISEFLHVQVQSDRRNLRRLVADGYLPVFTYDSTGMLEMASGQSLFFAFLPDGVDHIREEFQGNYGALLRAGLLALEADVAAGNIESLLEMEPGNKHTYDLAIQMFSSNLVFRASFKVWRIAKTLRREWRTFRNPAFER